MTEGLDRFWTAVRAQGENLRRSRAALGQQLSALDLTPWRGQSVGLVGIGASYNAARASIPSFWEAGIDARAWLPQELALPGAASGAGALVAISQGGRSSEIVACVSSLAGAHRTIALTDDPRSPLALASAATLSLSLLPDSEVRTLGYTGTLQALGLLRDALAGASRDWQAVASATDALLPQAEALGEALAERMAGLRAFDVVGSAASFGSAAQGALLLREVCRLPSAAFETHNYLHGPIEALERGRALIAVGGAREAALAASMAGAGVTVLLVTCEQVGTLPDVTVFQLATGPRGTLPLLEVVPLQVLAGALAGALGAPVGRFRHHQDDTKID